MGHECSVQLSYLLCTFDGHDQLRNHWENLALPFVQKIIGAQDGKESVGVHLLSQTIKENGQVVMIVQRLRRHLPQEF